MRWLLGAVLLLFLTQNHFTPKNLYSDIPSGSEATVELIPILSQKFTYLGEGSQVWAFVSEDQCTVLKLFKARHQKPFKSSRFLSHLMRTKRDWRNSEERWKQKFNDTCRRYKWAMLDLKDETGLIYLHFEKTPISLPITLKSKQTYQIDLSRYPFILQKKATLANSYLYKHPEKKEQAARALKEFFITRLQKGYTDPRQSLSINYGFVDDVPIQIDVGKIEPFAGDPTQELQKIHSHVDEWVSRL